jgi:homogentisate 1,2-dioxygenase
MDVTPSASPAGVALANAGYMSGFGNGFETEALPGALPVGRNSPQRCAYGLYAEQLSGSPFTAPRASNSRSWLYRIRPTVRHIGRFRKVDPGLWRTAPCAEEPDLPIQPLRWDPLPIPSERLSFLEGMRTITTAGDAAAQSGMAAHIYTATRDMRDEAFWNADAEMLVVPEQGRLRIRTEFGVIEAEPAEIAVIPRGVKFAVDLPDGRARGYVCENYGGAFTLPERGPIGANCLANQRDFLSPVAAYEDRDAPHQVTVKWGGTLWRTEIAHSPLDVVAWHGNYAPYKYDLRRYSPVGPILFDHADPSIFTVLTAPSPRRAPPTSTSCCSRALDGGGEHLPPALVPHEHHERVHGPHLRPVRRQAAGLHAGRLQPAQLHAAAWPRRRRLREGQHRRAQAAQAGRHHGLHVRDALPQRVTAYAASLPQLQAGYIDCWSGLKKTFDPTRR